MHHADAGRQRVTRTREPELAPVHEDASLVRRVESREDLAERALARPVFAAKGVTGPFGDFKGDVAQRLHARKALREMLEANGGRWRWSRGWKRHGKQRHPARDDTSFHVQVLLRHIAEAPRFQLPRPRAEVVLAHSNELHGNDLWDVLLEMELVHDRLHADVA